MFRKRLVAILASVVLATLLPPSTAFGESPEVFQFKVHRGEQPPMLIMVEAGEAAEIRDEATGESWQIVPVRSPQDHQGRLEGRDARTAVEVEGATVADSGRRSYRLRVRMKEGAAEEPYEALLVYAEPGHQLLLAHVAGEHRPLPTALAVKLKQESPFAYIRGELSTFEDVVHLPYAPPAAEQHHVVVTLWWAGRETLVTAAQVDPRQFEVSTAFTQGNGPTRVAGPYEHCCRGDRCSRMCTNCPGPFLVCDLIDCTIECIDN